MPFHITLWTLLAGGKLLYCIEKYGVVVVVGQTGCGKTTRKFPNCLQMCIIRDGFKNFRSTSFRLVGLLMLMSSHVRSLGESQLLPLLPVWLMKSGPRWVTKYVPSFEFQMNIYLICALSSGWVHHSLRER
jgi:hypothetical protein